MDKKKTNLKYYIGVILLLLALPLFISSPYWLHVVIMILFWAFLGSSWNIIGGFAGRLSLGHGAFLATGAYTSSLMFKYLGVSPWFGLLIGGLAAALLGFLVGYPTLRLRGAYYALSTVAFAEGIRTILTNTTDIGSWHTGGAEGFIVPLLGEAPLQMQFNSKVPYYYIILALLIIVILICLKIEKSKFGYYLTALREDEDAAAMIGVNTTKVKIKAAVLSAFLAGVGGVFYAQLIRYLEPNAVAGALLSNQIVFLVIVGGKGTIFGPILGAIILTLVSEISRTVFHQVMGLHLFIYGVIVVLIVMFKPTGVIDVFNTLLHKVQGYIRRKGEKNAKTDSIGIKESDN